MGRALTAEVSRTQGWISMKRLRPAGQPGAGFVNQCGGRGDVWKAVSNRRLTLKVTHRVRDRESERNYGWALNFETLEGNKRIRRPQERKKKMSIFKDVSWVNNRKCSNIWPQNLSWMCNVTEYFQKAEFLTFVPFQPKDKRKERFIVSLSFIFVKCAVLDWDSIKVFHSI